MPKRKRGPGRPSLGDKARTRIVTIKLTEQEYAAIALEVARENLEINADPGATAGDKKPATVASWIRDQALDDLGIA